MPAPPGTKHRLNPKQRENTIPQSLPGGGGAEEGLTQGQSLSHLPFLIPSHLCVLCVHGDAQRGHLSQFD